MMRGGGFEIALAFLSSRFPGFNLVGGREKAVYHLLPGKGADQDDRVSCFTSAISV